jgi:hypothetical protein
VDGGSPHRPRSILQTRGLLFFTFYFLLLTLSSCQPQPPTVTLAFLGDISLGRGVDPAPASLAYLAPELRRADLALANLESPLGTDAYGRSDPSAGLRQAQPGGSHRPGVPKGRFAVLPGGQALHPDDYNLCAPAGRAGNLSDWGLDLLSLANNHRLDCGPDGPDGTRAALESAGLASLGPGSGPVYRTVNGLRLAFLAFDDVSAPLDARAATAAIRAARATGAQVVVAVHWGNEYQGGADDRQKFLAGQFAAAGAALVWGTHPHVLQPAEWIKPPAGSQPAGGSTLVLYSLGNALFDQPGLADTRRSALVVVEMGRRGVQSVRLVPFVIDVGRSRVVAPDAATAAIIRDRLNLP